MKGNTDSVGIRDLSRREKEIVSLAASGLTDKEIGRRLGISYGTVNTHWSRIRPKMNVANRSEAVSRFVKAAATREFGDLVLENARLMTELRRREDVENLGELAQTVADGVPFPIAILDFQKPKTVWINESARDAVGDVVEGCQTWSFGLARFLLDPADRKRFWLNARAVRKGNRAVDGATFFRLADGQRRWSNAKVKLLGAGPVLGAGLRYVVAMAQETDPFGSSLTDDDLQKGPVREAIAELGRVVEERSTGVTLFDRELRVIKVCENARRIWGRELVEADGGWMTIRCDIRDPFTGRLLARDEWPHARALEGHTVRLQLLDILDSEGGCKRILCTAAPVRDLEGVVVAAALTMADLTH